MRTLSKDEIKLLSFPDATIVSFFINEDLTEFEIECNRSYLDFETGISFSLTAIKIGSNNVIIREWIDNAFVDITMNKKEDLILKDICEFMLLDNKLLIKGFGVISGMWIEYEFTEYTIAINVASWGVHPFLIKN